MRLKAHGTWNAILDHRFFREVATDAIDEPVFARYLRIEYGFVDTAARTLGCAVAEAPSFQERRRSVFMGWSPIKNDSSSTHLSGWACTRRSGQPCRHRD
jgi:thiaminase